MSEPCVTHDWFHGTPAWFDCWKPPALVFPRDPLLRPHSFHSLSADLNYAALHQGRRGGICSASMMPTARVLDLRVESDASLMLWEIVRATPLGANHAGIGTAQAWFSAHRRGTALQYSPVDDSQRADDACRQTVMMNPTIDLADRVRAARDILNNARVWIEQVISLAECMGYDAVIGLECARAIPTSPSTQLFVFNSEVLSQPRWLKVPACAAAMRIDRAERTGSLR